MQSSLLRLGLLIVVSLLLLPNISSSQDVSLIADGGLLGFWPVINEVRMTVLIENGSRVSRLHGSVSHPFGDGDFEIQTEAASIVKSVSITPFADRVNFDVELSDTIPDSLTKLFQVIPGKLSEPENIRYPQGTYPFPLQWHFCEAFDHSGSLIQAQLFTDPILSFSDVSFPLPIYTFRFPQEVIEINIVGINDAVLYYTLKTMKIAPNYFEGDGIVWGVAPFNRMPLTFEVVLVDGSRYIIRNPHFEDEIRLFPPSEVDFWDIYL